MFVAPSGLEAEFAHFGFRERKMQIHTRGPKITVVNSRVVRTCTVRDETNLNCLGNALYIAKLCKYSMYCISNNQCRRDEMTRNLGVPLASKAKPRLPWNT